MNLTQMPDNHLLELLEKWVRKWHYEPCEEVVLPFSYEEVRTEVLLRMGRSHGY